MLKKPGPKITNVYMAVLWNPGGQTVILQRSMTICYIKESDYMEIAPRPMGKSRKMTEIGHSTPPFKTVKEVTEISHEKLPPMQKIISLHTPS